MVEPEITINGRRFKIGIRDIIQFIVTGLGIVGIYFLSSNRISTAETSITANQSSIADLYKKHEQTEHVISEMDKTGTHRSHEVDSNQQQLIDQNTIQIVEINRTLRDMGPKVDKIDTNVLWLMAKQLERNK